MSFQTPITIREAVEEIHAKKYLLPAIQREVVWTCEQIERLFDSLMRDYPIGSFLFWHVERKRTGNYQFYEFMREYSDWDNHHNAKANVTGQDDITGVLDGQQRLTALYLGLLGSYAYKEPWKRWTNAAAFPKRRLHLNLLSPAEEDSDLKFDFQFLTDDEAKVADDDTFWFRVGDVLNLKKQVDANNQLIKSGLMQRAPEKAAFANETLFKLREVVHDAKTINYFLEKDETLDKVLQIFIRVNSGGTVLSYSDLLLSVATAQWKKLDAREEIHALVDRLNQTGNGFGVDKDMVLKAALVLSDFKDIAFKVDNFNKSNMLTIESNWDGISGALSAAFELVAAFGFNRDTLTSNNAVIPIAYYLLKRGLPKNFSQDKKQAADRARIQKWLILSLVKRAFGGKADNVLIPNREVIAGSNANFPLDAIRAKFKGSTKALDFTADEIENLLESRYGQAYTFSLLALLYPTLDFRNHFHVDHIHPRSCFTKTRLQKRSVNEVDVQSFIERADLLPNLQLLEGIPNQQKSDTDFADWFNDTVKGPTAQADYVLKHFIPKTDFKITNFNAFFEQRKALLRDQLQTLLGVAKTGATP
jgi:uncharacterized protein with ParB-like and HNH nuclease domain